MKEYLKLVRVRHYVKNLLVLFPCFFAGEMGNLGLLLKNLYAFITLCLSSSFIYIMNDIRDRERDKLHPVKKERPIASGRIPVRKAVATEVALFLGISGMLLLGGMGVAAIGCCCAYVFINLLYSFWGKDIPVIDVAFLGSGYLIRVLFGGGGVCFRNTGILMAVSYGHVYLLLFRAWEKIWRVDAGQRG